MSSINNYLHHLNRPSNYNSLINNEKFITKLIIDVRNKLARNLSSLEKQMIIGFLQNMDPVYFVNKQPEEILQVLTKQLVNKILKSTCGNDQVNIHELLKSEIGAATDNDFSNISGSNVTNNTTTNNNVSSLVQQITGATPSVVNISSLLGISNINDIYAKINPSTNIQSMYLLLDTRYRVLDNDGTRFFKWNFVNNTTLQQGSVNGVNDILQIIAMRTYPLRIPYISTLDNPYKRVSMYITEFSGQSVIAQENRNYHFIYKSFVDDRFIDLDPSGEVNNSYFKFKQPISRIDTLTITFASPLQTVTFDTDRMQMNITAYGPTTTLVSTQNHNLETGDTVYITNFTTINPIFDIGVITEINNPEGLIATYINATTITIPVDSSSLLFTGPGNINVVNGSTAIVGNSTTFLTTFRVNDVISILNVKYRVAAIASDTSLTIATIPAVTPIDPGYAGVTANNLIYLKNNTIVVSPSVYFGSKRAFIPIEFEYVPINALTSAT